MSVLIRRVTVRHHRKLSPISQFIYTPAAATVTKETGLYGFNHLKTPKGFRRFVDDAIDRAGELVNYISRMPSSAEVIRTMDEISYTVCSVLDSAQLCRHTHPDREFVEEANKAALRMDEYLHYLNTNHTLYEAVLKAEKESNFLSEEAQRAACHLRHDFEKGGIHLSHDKLERVNELNMDISLLCQEFNENIIADPGYVDIYPSTRIPKRLQHLGKPIFGPAFGASRKRSGENMGGKGYRITTEPGKLSCILQWASDAEVRKMAYVQGNSVPRANLDVLDKLMAARHELAQILGCKSYAEFSVRPNMASSPEVVTSFLLQMSETVRLYANEEFEMIKNFKREHTGELLDDLEPWDETYFTSMMRSSIYDLDYSVVASYFPLAHCIEGLRVLTESLFGATFLSVPLAPGESWHPDVIKMSLHHPEEDYHFQLEQWHFESSSPSCRRGDLGFLYLDLYSRKGKYPGCAHFAIKGGRRLSEAEYQLPVVALVCNFSSSCDLSSARLHHWEVETLFHEFGHALHSLLSRTDCQHFSGTRVALDLAETPSNLFENYAWDYRVLKTFARHYSTGEIIPKKLVDSMQGAKKMFAATELQRQILYALIDQKLFGEPTSLAKDTISIEAELKSKYSCWKHVEGTHWHTRFSHLINYGAGYYSYLYAKCFSATIWKKLCQEDPLSKDTGNALRTRFLQHGGARDPEHLLNDLVGDGIVKHCNGGVIPDITALCEEMKLKLID